ncbi:YeiH family protein [Citreicella sp. C3M06]|uniref:YeiH family protein n=1 Tax=Citreicella sp. C3M06 TaxID=2841564 RepID=UPI00209136B6|nr:putative sulfate exporter family transporter [Citreicella sp. C3M06]
MIAATTCLNTARPALPGLAATALLAALGVCLWQLSNRSAMVSPMVVALMLGLLLGNAGLPTHRLAPGTALALRPVLRCGIVLLGFRLTFDDLAGLGFGGAALIVALVVVSFVVIRRAGALLGVSPALSELIAAGTSICGASAVLGMNTVTRGRDEEVAYAIACVTVFGTLSMLIYPLAQPLLHLSANAYGLWSGATIHEVAQAVGAGWALGETSGELATIAKLGRVLLLAPMILGLGLVKGKTEAQPARLAVPWFVFGFLGAIALNTAIALPPELISALTMASTFMLAMALGAMGLDARLSALKSEGWRPFLLGACGWIFISGAGLAAITLLRLWQ